MRCVPDGTAGCKRRVSFTTASINLTVVRLSYDSPGKAFSSAWRDLHGVLSVARWKKRLVRVAEMVSLQLLILRIIWTLDSSFGEGLPAGYDDEIGLAFEVETVLFGFGTVFECFEDSREYIWAIWCILYMDQHKRNSKILLINAATECFSGSHSMTIVYA